VKRLTAPLASLAVIFALAFGLSGCNVRFSPYAAVVNGSEISQSQLRAALAAINANASYKCAVESSGTAHITGAGQGTYNSAFSAEVLSILIQDKVVREYVSRLKLPEPADLVGIATSQVETSTAPPSTCPGSGKSLIEAFPPAYRADLVRFQVDEDALAAYEAGTSLVPSTLSGYVARHSNEMSLACVSVIEVASKATAQSLRTQLQSGANFATVAKAHSVDTTTAPQGGALGCIADAEFTAPLDTVLAGLKLHEISSPIAFSSDYLLLEVTSRQSESYSQVVTSVLGAEQPTLNKVFPEVIKAAKVQLDPQFGTWSVSGALAKVVANVSPPAALVPNSSANAGPSVSTATTSAG
jgi:hypothetical protein